MRASRRRPPCPRRPRAQRAPATAPSGCRTARAAPSACASACAFPGLLRGSGPRGRSRIRCYSARRRNARLGSLGSNHDLKSQSLPGCHYPTPQLLDIVACSALRVLRWASPAGLLTMLANHVNNAATRASGGPASIPPLAGGHDKTREQDWCRTGRGADHVRVRARGGAADVRGGARRTHRPAPG